MPVYYLNTFQHPMLARLVMFPRTSPAHAETKEAIRMRPLTDRAYWCPEAVGPSAAKAVAGIALPNLAVAKVASALATVHARRHGQAPEQNRHLSVWHSPLLIVGGHVRLRRLEAGTATRYCNCSMHLMISTRRPKSEPTQTRCHAGTKCL